MRSQRSSRVLLPHSILPRIPLRHPSLRGRLIRGSSKLRPAIDAFLARWNILSCIIIVRMPHYPVRLPQDRRHHRGMVVISVPIDTTPIAPWRTPGGNKALHISIIHLLQVLAVVLGLQVIPLQLLEQCLMSDKILALMD